MRTFGMMLILTLIVAEIPLYAHSYYLPFASSPSASSQLAASPDTIRLSLPKALELAKANYPAIKARQAAQNRAAKEIDVVRAEYLPNIGLTAYVNYGSNNSVAGTFFPYNAPVQGGIRADGIYTPVFGSFAALELSWAAFTFGKADSRIAAAQSEYERAELEVQNAIFQQQLATADAYLLALAAERLVSVQENNLRRSEIFYTIAKAKAVSGIVSGVDSSLAAAERSKARLLLLESRKSVQLQHIKLAELTGLPSTTVVLPDTLTFFSTIPRESPSELTASALEKSIASTPELRVAQKNVEVSAARTEVVQRSWLPSVRLWADFFGKGSGVQNSDNSFRTDFASGVAFQALNYTTAVSVQFDVFDLFRSNERAAAETARNQELRYDYDTKHLEAERRYENAAAQFRLALAQAEESPLQRAAAQATFSQSNARYESGLAPLTELVQSFYILSRADADVAVAYSNAWRALLFKAASLGDVELFLNQLK